ARRPGLCRGRVRSLAAPARRPQALGRCLLRQRHGQRRLGAFAPQPPRLAGGAADDHEPRRRPVAPGRLDADEARWRLASLPVRGGASADPDRQAAVTVKLVILDRDGTINEDRDDFVKSPAEWVPIAGSLEAIARLNHAGWHTGVA